MDRWIAVLGSALLVAACSGAGGTTATPGATEAGPSASQASPTDRPFKASMSGTEVTLNPSIPEGRCVEKAGVADALATFVGRGDATDLGPVDVVAEHCSDFDTQTYSDGRLTITVANGDILKGTYGNGVSTAPPPLNGFRDDFTFVDGGAGRFVVASGGGTESGFFNSDTNEWSLQMDGAISYGGD